MILRLISRKSRKMLISVFANRTSLILDRGACEISGPYLGSCVHLLGELHCFSFFFGGCLSLYVMESSSPRNFQWLIYRDQEWYP